VKSLVLYETPIIPRTIARGGIRKVPVRWTNKHELDVCAGTSSEINRILEESECAEVARIIEGVSGEDHKPLTVQETQINEGVYT